MVLGKLPVPGRPTKYEIFLAHKCVCFFLCVFFPVKSTDFLQCAFGTVF